MVHIIRLGALEGLAESSGCHGDEKPGSFCLACRGSSCIFFLALLLCLMFPNLPFFFFSAEVPAVILLEDHCRQMLRNSIWFSFLVVLVCLFYYFSSGLLCGEGWWWCGSGAGRDMGFCALLSLSQQYFLSHSHLQYLWQLNVFQEAERTIEVHFKTKLLKNSLLYRLCPATHLLKTVRISWSSKSRNCTTV